MFGIETGRSRHKRLSIVLSSMMVLGLASALLPMQPNTARADHSPQPTSVTIAGSLQSELGCSGDWQADCAATHLSYDASDEAWQGTWPVPAGNWEYKAPLNDSWTENYGRYAQLNGPNIPLNLGAASS